MGLRIKTNTLAEFSDLQRYVLSLDVRWAEGQRHMLFIDQPLSYYDNRGLHLRADAWSNNEVRMVLRGASTDFNLEWKAGQANTRTKRAIQQFVTTGGENWSRTVADPMDRIKSWRETKTAK